MPFQRVFEVEKITNSRAVAAEVALGAAESKADDQKRQPADGPPADPTSLPNGASIAVANVGDELSSLAVDLWEAAGLTVEWPCDPPDDSSPITCLTCMERTHRPGACELVATDECTVLQLVFATRVGNSWLDACDPLAAECKVLRWGTGMGGNGRDGATRLVHFFWWTKNPDSIVAAVTKVVAFAHRTDLVDYQIGTGASFVASIPNTCGTCGSNKHLPNQCPVVQLDLLGMGQDPTLASQVVLQARAVSPAAPTPASAAASAAAASGASSRRVTEAEWTSWPETPIDKIGPHVWCRHEIIRGPGACRIDCKWAHLQHSMESTQRSILRCAHGRACPDMFHCRRDHGERASAQRAAAEAKEKAAAERRANAWLVRLSTAPSTSSTTIRSIRARAPTIPCPAITIRLLGLLRPIGQSARTCGVRRRRSEAARLWPWRNCSVLRALSDSLRSLLVSLVSVPVPLLMRSSTMSPLLW